jgi:hypothetical protein
MILSSSAGVHYTFDNPGIIGAQLQGQRSILASSARQPLSGELQLSGLDLELHQSVRSAWKLPAY